MKSKIEEIFDSLLNEIKRGRSVEDCLEEYPQFAEALEPLLRLATNIQELPKPEPSQEAIAQALGTIKKATAEERRKEIRFSFRKIFSLQPAIIRAVAAVVLIVIIGWTTVFLSAKSLPGDLLYPVKLFTEKVQYVLTINPEGKAELHLVFADKRTNELLLSFKEGEEINRKLLSTMLNEAQLALEHAESLPAERSIKFVESVERCNHRQMEVLEKIKPMVCGSDTSVINEAINLCTERHHCIEHKIHPESNIDRCPCPCW